jgi:glycine dehydrogenase subunit 2
MIEPTETESKETLDQFISAMKAIAQEAHDNPDLVHGAPHSTELSRLDEVTAAREPNLRWKRPATPAETPPIPEPALAG